jgi:hypothetical protein
VTERSKLPLDAIARLFVPDLLRRVVALIVGPLLISVSATVMPHLHTWISKRLSVASGKPITVIAAFTIFAVESIWMLLAAVASRSTTLTALSSFHH